MFTREFLVEIRRRTLRRGVWFKTLDRVERGILSLTVRIVDRVESALLGVELVKILGGLRDALKNGFVGHMESYGLRMTLLISARAANLGNDLAEGWAHDSGFVRYLAFMSLNKPTGWGL